MHYYKKLINSVIKINGYKMKFSKNEWKYILIISIVLGFVFSFKEWGPGKTPDITIGIKNWIISIILVIIAFSIHNIAHKIIAKQHSATSELDLWRINYKKIIHRSKPLALGNILAVLLSILSNGSIKFSALESQNIKCNLEERLGRKFKHLKEIEIAYIALAGPVINLFLALLFKAFNNPVFDKFILINYSIAIYSLIPFNKLDGSRIWFGSYYIYIFFLILTIACIALMGIMNSIGAILLAALTAFVFFMLFTTKD